MRGENRLKVSGLVECLPQLEIRESLDGATMYQVTAAAEGWSADLERWQAEASDRSD